MVKQVERLRRITALLLVIFTLVPNGFVFTALSAEPDGDDPGTVKEVQDFGLRAYNTPEHASGNLRVNWDAQGEDWSYRYYQRPLGASEWEERSTKYGKPIQVLNVTPSTNSDQFLDTWLKTFREETQINGADIRLTTVRQAAFEGNPDTYLKDADGRYAYDVVVIGFADLNYSTWKVPKSIAAIEAFLKAGGGVLFGHDTLYDAEPLDSGTVSNIAGTTQGNARWRYTGSDPRTGGNNSDWFNDHGGNEKVWIAGNWSYSRLAGYVGVIPGVSADGSYWTSRFGSRGREGSNDWYNRTIQYSNGTSTTKHNGGMPVSFVKVTDGGFLTSYPNELPEGTVLTVPNSHVNGTASSGKEWMTYVQDETGKPFPTSAVGGRFQHQHSFIYDGVSYRDSGYLVSNRNAALIQTGHYSGRATRDEVAILVNTMYHLAQLTQDTELSDSSALDLAAPEAPAATLAAMGEGEVTVNLLAYDQGTAYEMYVEALHQDGVQPARSSNVVEQSSTTGTKGYLYLVSEKAGGQISLSDLAAQEAFGNYLPVPAAGALQADHAYDAGALIRLSRQADAGKHLHVTAYDYAGNLSEIATYAVDSFRPTIRVQVVDGAGAPIPGAAVMALGQSQFETDAQGACLLYPDSVGTYTVAAHKEGYNMGVTTVSITAQTFVADARITLETLDSGSIYGFIKDAGSGAPIGGATVKTLTGRQATSDDFGFYVISGLVPGAHTVVAAAERYNSEFTMVQVPLGTVEQHFALIRRDGENNRYLLTGVVQDSVTGLGLSAAAVTHGPSGLAVQTDDFGGYAMGGFENGAQAFDYRRTGYAPNLGEQVVFRSADEERNISLEPLDGNGRVVVRVKDPEGRLLSGVTVMMAGSEQTTGETGETAFTLPHGSYALFAQRDGYNARARQVLVDRDYQEITLTLEPGSQGGLYGRVLREDEPNTGIPGATVETVNPDGGSTVSDALGYYVLAPLEPGLHAVVAHLGGYLPAADNLSVSPNAVNRHDFYLHSSQTPAFFIRGQVKAEGEGRPVPGATVRDELVESKRTLSDDHGYYALMGYPAGSLARVVANRGEARSATEEVTVQSAPAWQDLVIRADLTVVVQYLDAETNRQLFAYSIPSSRGAAAFRIEASPYPDYRLVTQPGWMDIDPATVTLDDNGEHRVSFLYRYNRQAVTVQACLVDGTPIPGVSSFTVMGETGGLFTYEQTLSIPGYTFARRDAAITLTEGEAAVYRLYYYRSTGNMTVKAVDLEEGTVIGTLDRALSLEETYLVSEENAPTADRIPATQYYSLYLAGSYVGVPGTDRYTFTGTGEELPDAVYAYRRNQSPVTVELRLAETGALLTSRQETAPQGKLFVVTLEQAEAIVAESLPNAGAYTFVTREDQKVFVEAGQAQEKIVFYLSRETAPPDTVTLEIQYRYLDEEGQDRIITSARISGLTGEEKTLTPAQIQGWVLRQDQPDGLTVTLTAGMDPVSFYYERDMVAITVQAEDQTGAPLPLDQSTRTLQVPRHSPYTLYAPAIAGYRAVSHRLGETAYEGAVVSFTAGEMATGHTVAFVYEAEGLEDFSVSVPVTGYLGDRVLYRYTAVFPKNAGGQTVKAFPLPGYEVTGGGEAQLVITEAATPASVSFFYLSLDTHVVIRLINDNTGEERVHAEAAVLGEAFSVRAPYVTGWHLRDEETVRVIDAVSEGDEVVFRYGSIPEAGVVVTAVEVNPTTGEPVRELKAALPDVSGWQNGATVTVDVKTLLNLEGTPNYYRYAPSPADPAGTGAVALEYDALHGHHITVFYTKELAEVRVEALETEGGLITFYTTNQRKGEVFSATAPRVDPGRYALLGGQSRQAVALEGQAVQFFYKALGSGEIQVLAVDEQDENVVLFGYTLSGTPGQSLTVLAPDLSGQGWTLGSGEPSRIRVTVAEQNAPVLFRYEDSRAVLTLYTKVEGREEAEQYLTQPHAPGGAIRVHAPYRDGLVLYAAQVNGGALQPVEDAMQGLPLVMDADQDVIFHYRPIEEVIDRYQVTVTITGEDAHGDQLYEEVRRITRNSGEVSIDSRSVEGYTLMEILVDGVSQDAEDGPALLNVGEEDISVTFRYRALGSYVTILLLEEESDLVLDELRIEAMEGQAFTYRAPHVEGFYLVSSSMIGTIDQVAGDGTSVLRFHYRRLTADVVLITRECGEEGVLIRLFELDTGDWEPGAHEVAAPDLTGDYYRYAGNVQKPNDESGILEIDYTPGGEAQLLEVYYNKEMIPVQVEARKDSQTGTLLAQSQQFVRRGEAATVAAPKVPDYHLISESAVSLIPHQETTVTFLYKQDDSGSGGGNGGGGGGGGGAQLAELTVIGRDRHGSELHREVKPRQKVGAVVTVEAPLLEGCRLKDEQSKTITIAAENKHNVVVFLYEAEGEFGHHTAYIQGYEDGAFRPEHSMTRAEAAMIFFRLTGEAAQNPARNNPYSDVAEGQWYTQAILTLSAQGILEGYEDGRFRPDANITRAEMAAICARHFGMDTAASLPFPDVSPVHWAVTYLENAYSQGWIVGYEDGTFRPDTNIRRVEMVTMMNRILNRKTRGKDLPAHARAFSDVPASHWGYEAVMEAANEHQFEYQNDGYELWKP